MSELEQFIRYLRTEKRVSEHTITGYRTDLEQFTSFLRSTYEMEVLSAAQTMHIRSWLAEMKAGGLSSRTLHRKRSSLSTFFRYARKKGWVENDPVSKSAVPKMEKRLPVFASEEQMRKLLDEVLISQEGFPGKRDHLLVTLLYETGIRLSELIGIQRDDVDFASGHLKVLGKRNKERLIPLSDKTLKQVKAYLQERSEIRGSGEAFLLCTDKGAKLYPRLVYSKVNTYLGVVSSLDKRSPHILRHTFATHMLNNGAQLNTVKELLGHANLAATQVYTHNTIEKLKNIHEQNHPKG